MRVFIGKNPRSIVISSNGYNLLFRRYHKYSSVQQQYSKSSTVVIKSIPDEALTNETMYREIQTSLFNGLLGLVSMGGDIFVAVIAGVQNVGYPRWKLEKDRVIPVSYTHLDVYKRQGDR